jgi:hypothetical protein
MFAMYAASRPTNAVAAGSTRAIAPPSWATKISHSGLGAEAAASIITSIAASPMLLKLFDFQ